MSVYFATCREVNAVKIGSSLDPHGRVREIQTCCPLPVVLEATVPGNHEEEFQYHARFEEDRIQGEWFRITEMIELIISNNPPKAPLAKQEAKEGRRARKIAKLRARAEKPTPLTPWERQERRILAARYEAAMAEMRAAQST